MTPMVVVFPDHAGLGNGPAPERPQFLTTTQAAAQADLAVRQQQQPPMFLRRSAA